jgi:hypothetical protein
VNYRLPNPSGADWRKNYDRTFRPPCDVCSAKAPALIPVGGKDLCLSCFAKGVNAAADDFRENGSGD